MYYAKSSDSSFWEASTVGESPRHRVQSLKVTLLSTMLADGRGIGEWGFAALIEADGRRILFDTGARPNTALSNADELDLELAQVSDVILSHHHGDHTGGLLTLRRELMRENPDALKHAHVAAGIFQSRPFHDVEQNPMISMRVAYEALGGVFVEHHSPIELWPGVWLSGSVPRRHPERNWSGQRRVLTTEGLVEDTIPEDQALVIDTKEGLVILVGCGHAGIINTIAYAREQIREVDIHAVIGGLHLFQTDDDRLRWTGEQLSSYGLEHLVGAHCTGIEATFRLRTLAGLERRTAVVGAVGSTFELEQGIEPGYIAR